MKFTDINEQFNNINIKMDTIIYARCSTPSQNNLENNGLSIDIQVNACNNFCKSNNFNIISTVSEICSARSGNNQKKLIQLIDMNENIYLVVFDVTRFSRSIADGTNFMNNCIQKNIVIHFIKEKVKVSTQQDLCLILPYLMASQNESDNISNRIKESINYRKRLGSHFGKPKFGYKKILTNNIYKLYSDDKEQYIIKFIFKLKYGGYIPTIKLLFDNIKGLSDQPINNLNNLNDTNIVSFGDYTLEDILNILNSNGIKNRNMCWTLSNIETVLKNNKIIKTNDDQKTENLIFDLYKIPYTQNSDKIIDNIYRKYLIINGYPLVLDRNLLLNIDNKFKILNFLNRHHVNFKFWNMSCLCDYETYCENYRNNPNDDDMIIIVENIITTVIQNANMDINDTEVEIIV